MRDYLREVNYTITWELWPGKGRYFEGGEPHGARFTTYLNEPALEALNNHEGEMPDGAIIVKQNFTPDIVFDLNTIMYKVEGFDPENNDWFWAKIGARGDVQAEGRIAGCQTCHGGVKDNDFIFTSPLKAATEATGRGFFISKGCAACHGQDAQGSEIAPAVAGHSEAVVMRQVRNPRFRMPAFTAGQVSSEELEAIAHYISSLEGDAHAHVEPAEVTVAVEMHHWMALEGLKVHDTTEAIHHVQHIIELLGPGSHRTQMEATLESLQAGETHDPEHDIEGMLAGTAAPALTLVQLHLSQALVSLAIDDLADGQHHVAHAQEVADASQRDKLAETQLLLAQGEVRGAEHEIEELVSQE